VTQLSEHSAFGANKEALQQCRMFCGCADTIFARCSKRTAAVEQGVQRRDQEAFVQLGRSEMDEECGVPFQKGVLVSPGLERRDAARAHTRETSNLKGVRTCVVCFDKEITTVALPCRHSSVCGDCMQDIRTRTNKCPICRAKIMLIRDGHYDMEFVGFTLLAVETVQNDVKTLAGALKPCMMAVWAFLLPGVKTLARALKLCLIASWAFILLALVAFGLFFVRIKCDELINMS